MTESITCVYCPLGCRISFNKKVDRKIFTGHECKRGEKYAIREINNPMRLLTTTVKIYNGEEKLLPVRSKNEIPKNMIMRGIIVLSKIKVKAPIKCGELIYKNILETGVDIIASRNIEIKVSKNIK